MQIRWVCERPDGSIYILASAHVEQLAREGFDDPRALVLSKLPEPAVTVTEMPQGWEPPTNRQFRDAWRGKGRAAEGSEHPECNLIEVDMPHAREIHRGWIRRKRIALLADLDVQYQRADEVDDKNEKQRVAREKQRLRDLPGDPRIEAAKTPADLLAIKP